MKSKLLLMTLFLVCSACTTVEFVRKDFTPKKQGILRYYPTDDAEKQQKYKDKVNAQAREFCGGNFQITKEYQAKDDAGTSSGVGTGFSIGGGGGMMIGTSTRNTAMFNFVEFACQ